jgi:hypothetical protein
MHWKWLAAIAVILVAVTRIPVAPARLSVEAVNLAFAIDELNPVRQQPHAPGFPFFVTAGRILAFFIPHLTERAYWYFLAISILITAACLVLTFKLASQMYSGWEARAALLLLVVNPIFWFASVQSPLWPHLCFFTLLTAWFSWRAWDGDTRSVFYGAFTLALSFGFLPEVALYMLPLWLVSAWKGTRSTWAIARGLAVMLAGVALALDILWVSTGNLEAFGNILAQYPFGTALPSVDLSITEPRLWVRSLGRFVLWNLIGVGLWSWALLWRRGSSVFPGRKHAWFFLLWILPAAIIHVVGGVSGPGQMLVYIPPICLIGARVLYGLGQSTPVQIGIPARELSLTVALVSSVLLFGEFITVPQTSEAQSAGVVSRALNIATYGVWETSLGPLRWSSELSDTTFWELGPVVRADRPVVIVAMERGDENGRSVAWRIASYYERNQDIWVLNDSPAAEVRRIRGRLVMDLRKESPLVIPVPRGGRIIWLMDPGGEFMKAAQSQVPVQLARKYVTFTDLREDAGSFTIGPFVFRPS